MSHKRTLQELADYVRAGFDDRYIEYVLSSKYAKKPRELQKPVYEFTEPKPYVPVSVPLATVSKTD